MQNHHHPYAYANPLVIPTSNSRPSSPVASTSTGMAYDHHARAKRPGEDVDWDATKRMRMDEPFARRQGGNTAETDDIMAGIRGAFTPTGNPSIHGYPPQSQGFIPPVGFGRGRQTLSQTPVREGSGREGSAEEEGESEGSDEDEGVQGRGKEEEERKRPKMTRGSR